MFELREEHMTAMSNYMRNRFELDLLAFAEEFYEGENEDIPQLIQETKDQAEKYRIESQGHIFQLLYWNINHGVNFENSKGMERCKKFLSHESHSENMRMKLVEGELDAKEDG